MAAVFMVLFLQTLLVSGFQKVSNPLPFPFRFLRTKIALLCFIFLLLSSLLFFSSLFVLSSLLFFSSLFLLLVAASTNAFIGENHACCMLCCRVLPKNEGCREPLQCAVQETCISHVGVKCNLVLTL